MTFSEITNLVYANLYRNRILSSHLLAVRVLLFVDDTRDMLKHYFVNCHVKCKNICATNYMRLFAGEFF